MKLTNTSTASQRALIKALLRERPHSTLELRAKPLEKDGKLETVRKVIGKLKGSSSLHYCH